MRSSLSRTVSVLLPLALAAAARSERPAAAAADIPVMEGDSVVVRVTSVSTARCESVSVSGSFSRVLFSGVGRCGGRTVGGGLTVTLAPVPAEGVLSLFLSSAPGGGQAQLSGADPEYVVGMDDGIFDADFNDVVLSVTIHGGPPELECTPETVERGQEVVCKVTGRGTVRGWEFSGGEHGTATSLTEREWRGPAVWSGEVMATVEVNGDEEVLEASFEVTPRDWHWKVDEHFSFQDGRGPMRPFTPPSFQDRGDVTTLGWNCSIDWCGKRRIQPDLMYGDGGYRVRRAESGPNEGLWYVDSVYFRMDRGSRVNPALLPEAPLGFMLRGDQARECRESLGLPPADTLSVNFYIYNHRCGGVNVNEVIARVAAHESWGTRGDNGHESVARAAAMENDIYRGLEDLVEPTRDQLRARVRQVALPMQNNIHERAGDEDRVSGNFHMQVWVWNERSRRFQRTVWSD